MRSTYGAEFHRDGTVKFSTAKEFNMPTKIEWTEETWNPTTGCTKYSEGCEHCYAASFAKRLKAMGNARYVNGFKVTVHRFISKAFKMGKAT